MLTSLHQRKSVRSRYPSLILTPTPDLVPKTVSTVAANALRVPDEVEPSDGPTWLSLANRRIWGCIYDTLTSPLRVGRSDSDDSWT